MLWCCASEMGSKQNLEVIQEALDQLLVEENGGSVHRRTLLSELRSQLESWEQDEESAEVEETTSPSASHIENTDRCSKKDEIMKELKNIKRQNLITHGLVSAMIVVTLTWQLSEVSLILKIKHVLSSPLESLGGIVQRVLNGQPKVNVEEVMKQASSIKDKVSSFDSPVLKVPLLELPGFDTSEED
ncbi:uncharacterized protein [Henckelia pumila]|uniref:uncharacterized protein isoform X1 n=1 Tax=Henckelia pumila TaxID=405737 RepID=UPI003C6E794B